MIYSRYTLFLFSFFFSNFMCFPIHCVSFAVMPSLHLACDELTAPVRCLKSQFRAASVVIQLFSTVILSDYHNIIAALDK